MSPLCVEPWKLSVWPELTKGNRTEEVLGCRWSQTMVTTCTHPQEWRLHPETTHRSAGCTLRPPPGQRLRGRKAGTVVPVTEVTIAVHWEQRSLPGPVLGSHRLERSGDYSLQIQLGVSPFLETSALSTPSSSMPVWSQVNTRYTLCHSSTVLSDLAYAVVKEMYIISTLSFSISDNRILNTNSNY